MTTKSHYYVPEQSKLPILAAAGLGVIALGAGSWVQGKSPVMFLAGALLLAFTLYVWFSTVIKENMEGLPNAQVKRSYVWGMGWFIFSEVMFFAAFFGALLYVRTLALPWLSEGDTQVIWNGFEADWPLMTTPDQALSGEAARVGRSGAKHELPRLGQAVGLVAIVEHHSPDDLKLDGACRPLGDEEQQSFQNLICGYRLQYCWARPSWYYRWKSMCTPITSWA